MLMARKKCSKDVSRNRLLYHKQQSTLIGMQTPDAPGNEKHMNVLAVLKDDGSRHVYLYDDVSRFELIRVLTRHANDPDLDFTPANARDLIHRALGIGD